MKNTDFNSCQLNRSAISKLSEDISSSIQTKVNHSWIQPELEKIDVYLGDKRT
jgi:hypothetical protein